MNDYELTVVLSGETTPAKKKTILAKLEKEISSLKGKLGKVDDWGKIDMAYKIAGQISGNYVLFPIKLEAGAMNELNVRLKMNSDIMRYLLVRV
jgi:small subunit ribosomal protein S6